MSVTASWAFSGRYPPEQDREPAALAEEHVQLGRGRSPFRLGLLSAA